MSKWRFKTEEKKELNQRFGSKYFAENFQAYDKRVRLVVHSYSIRPLWYAKMENPLTGS